LVNQDRRRNPLYCFGVVEGWLFGGMLVPLLSGVELELELGGVAVD
jgi:hypothetical protein